MNVKSSLSLAVQYCEQNNVTSLALLIPGTISSNAIIDNYRYRSIVRTSVPLLSIASAFKAVDCVKLLLNNGADIEKPDANILILLN